MHSFDIKDSFIFVEYTVVLIFLLLPPLFSSAPFVLPAKPEGLYRYCLFCINTLSWAAYEELLYRLYTPQRLALIYTRYIESRIKSVQNNRPPKGRTPLICRNGHQTIHRVIIQHVIPLLFTELPALLLFTLAHRYLGLLSMLFAAFAGALLRIAYKALAHYMKSLLSIMLVAFVHGLWNMGVYLYLWHTSGSS